MKNEIKPANSKAAQLKEFYQGSYSVISNKIRLNM